MMMSLVILIRVENHCLKHMNIKILQKNHVTVKVNLHTVENVMFIGNFQAH